MTVRSITQVPIHIYIKKALASCTTTSLFYVNLLKERFFYSSAPFFSAKADAKVRIISDTCKYFKNFF